VVELSQRRLTHLKQLEAESIHIIREVAAEFEKPVMLYSIGKDSSVLVRLAIKAFHPAPLPFPLMHIDTTWKFREMIEFRDRFIKENRLDLIVYTNQDGVRDGINPFDHGSEKYTTIMKTEALVQALGKYGFDAAFGGARRDEEKSRAKERIYSFRDRFQRWDPKNQRPELWNLYNAKVMKGESIRVFPLSTGPSSTSGSTSGWRTSRSCRCTSPRSGRWWSATARSSWSTTIACGCARVSSRCRR
jgi:sulfate adenylyltransferase subunit 2